MIFVTVGTHEQPFNRLVQYMDEMKKNNQIEDEIVIQSGYSTYEPQCCTWQKLYPYQQMLNFVEKARIVITHGGPSSFIMPLQMGKTPIVVPRKADFGEHVNNHQVDFSKAVAERMGTIIVVEDINNLGETIKNYDESVSRMGKGLSSNNARFNAELEKIVACMFEKKEKHKK